MLSFSAIYSSREPRVRGLCHRFHLRTYWTFLKNQQIFQSSRTAPWSQMKESTGMSTAYGKIGVIGAGAWGTALALAAAQAGRSVSLWTRAPEVFEQIVQQSENVTFLPGVKLPPAIRATGDPADAADADAVLV